MNECKECNKCAEGGEPIYGPTHLQPRWNELQQDTEGALGRQVGGNHYKDFVIQPVEFITKNSIGFLPGCIIKRACRFDKPGGKGIQDLEKIKHEIDLIIQLGGWGDE